MKRNERNAFNALKKGGATVFESDDSCFIISAEQGDGVADYYQEFTRERKDPATGRILNAFGIATWVHDILDRYDLHAEWINPGTVGVYR
mgnify:FL=1